MHPVFPVLCSDLGSITEGWDRARLAQRGGQGCASVTLRCSTLALSSIITQIHLGCSAGSGACEQLIPRSSSHSRVRSGNWSSFSADPPGFQAWLRGVKVPGRSWCHHPRINTGGGCLQLLDPPRDKRRRQSPAVLSQALHAPPAVGSSGMRIYSQKYLFQPCSSQFPLATGLAACDHTGVEISPCFQTHPSIPTGFPGRFGPREVPSHTQVVACVLWGCTR